MKAIFILSSKSSGSTALQNYLKSNFSYKTVQFTQHHEEETLYWSKVASVLGLPQRSLYRSVVPLKAERAVRELNLFFEKNDLPHIQCNLNTSEKEFQEYFFQLIKKMGGKFIEKSPHHLYNNSNLELLLKFISRYNDKIEFVILGLVRHPQAVIYSAWRRWKYFPQRFQNEWLVSYRNLLDWKDQLNINIIKYEDLVTGKIKLSSIIDEEEDAGGKFKFKTSSLNKWNQDSLFGFIVSKNVKFQASKFEYNNFKTQKSVQWKISLMKYKIIHVIKSIIK